MSRTLPFGRRSRPRFSRFVAFGNGTAIASETLKARRSALGVWKDFVEW